MLKLIEKLIEEHGSSSILRERLLLLRDQMAQAEKKISELELKVEDAVAETRRCGKEKDDLKLRITELEAQIRELEAVPDYHDAKDEIGYVCLHCGSSNIKRTGSREDPTWGMVGLRRLLFTCNDCGEQSDILPSDGV